jgi:hypothetical protein
MITIETDQKWQELQDRIDNAFGYLLRGDTKRIEYKPQASIPLLEASSHYKLKGLNNKARCSRQILGTI